MGVGVGGSVGVAVGAGVNVAVGVDVCVAVGTGVSVAVAVLVRVAVGGAVAVALAVAEAGATVAVPEVPGIVQAASAAPTARQPSAKSRIVTIAWVRDIPAIFTKGAALPRPN